MKNDRNLHHLTVHYFYTLKEVHTQLHVKQMNKIIIFGDSFGDGGGMVVVWWYGDDGGDGGGGGEE